MIIKSKTHRYSPQVFQRLVNYVYADKGRSEEHRAWSYFHNLTAFTPEGVMAAFRENEGFRKSRQNGIALRHLIMSFSPDDSRFLNPEIIQDLVEQFLKLRQEKGVVFGRLHEHDGHIHVHLLISGSEYRSAKSTRQSKAEFQRVHRELEAYQRAKYPELSHSVVKIRGKNRDPERAKPLSEGERQMKARLGRTPTKKEALQARLTAWLERAPSAPAYYDKLQAEGFELYLRASGTVQGIISPEGIKFRFRTLGISPAMIKGLMSEREKRLAQLQVDRTTARSDRDRDGHSFRGI